MTIDWGSLGIVALVALAAAVAVVALVAFALVGLSARTQPAGGATASRLSPTGGTVVATGCLLAAVAIVGYGLFLIVAH
ncbi:hypothetical protein [Pseudonocardia sp. GCM10023141]|uniref:hypothetical protein n=1 Tax=Pseudonocardia sp. GCM10023141 TaxID=3252653 RepID=UPI00361C472E